MSNDIFQQLWDKNLERVGSRNFDHCIIDEFLDLERMKTDPVYFASIFLSDFEIPSMIKRPRKKVESKIVEPKQLPERSVD